MRQWTSRGSLPSVDWMLVSVDTTLGLGEVQTRVVWPHQLPAPVCPNPWYNYASINARDGLCWQWMGPSGRAIRDGTHRQLLICEEDFDADAKRLPDVADAAAVENALFEDHEYAALTILHEIIHLVHQNHHCKLRSLQRVSRTVLIRASKGMTNHTICGTTSKARTIRVLLSRPTTRRPSPAWPWTRRISSAMPPNGTLEVSTQSTYFHTTGAVRRHELETRNLFGQWKRSPCAAAISSPTISPRYASATCTVH